MENIITLQWKEFSIPLDRLSVALKNILVENYDGIVCGEEEFNVVFKEAPTQEEIDALNEFWDEVTQEQFNPSLREIIAAKLNEATILGQSIILDASVENIEMGITQAGKTKAVSDYCGNLIRYLQTGSLYAAISEIDLMISNGIPSELSPFVTEVRLTEYKTKLVDYLT